MNYYAHHIGDYIKATAHLSMLEDAAYRRLIDAYYTREAPLPAEKKACHRLARATTKQERDAVDTILDEFFRLEDDGWHQGRCDKEIIKCQEKEPAAEEKRENDKERQRRARERRKQLFEELASHGISLPFNATTEMLQAELSRVTSGNPSQHVTQPVTRDNTLTQEPIANSQEPRTKKNPVEAPKALAASSPGKPATATRGSRLPPDWKLPKPWGEWALENRKAWTPDHVRHVADSFRDFWIAKAGADAVKLDWQATWRNWVRKEKDPAGTPTGPAPRTESSVCECCGNTASKRIGQAWYCPEHDQFSERIAA